MGNVLRVYENSAGMDFGQVSTALGAWDGTASARDAAETGHAAEAGTLLKPGTARRQSGGVHPQAVPGAGPLAYRGARRALFPSLTAFSISFNPWPPSAVKMLSGWNCTASTGSSR